MSMSLRCDESGQPHALVLPQPSVLRGDARHDSFLAIMGANTSTKQGRNRDTFAVFLCVCFFCVAAPSPEDEGVICRHGIWRRIV